MKRHTKPRTVRHRHRISEAAAKALTKQKPAQARSPGRPRLDPNAPRLATYGFRLPAALVDQLDQRGRIEGKGRSALAREAFAALLAKPDAGAIAAAKTRNFERRMDRRFGQVRP